MSQEVCISSCIKVVVVTDYALLGDGIEKILKDLKDIKVVGRDTSIENVLNSIKTNKSKPDILITDMDLFKREGLKVSDYIKENGISVRILLWADSFDEEAIRWALPMGIYGFLPKYISSSDMIKAIKVVHAGEIWMARKYMSKLVTQNFNNEIAKKKLTGREKEIALLISRGCSNKAIADKLSICEQTVKSHISSIFKKIEVDSRLKIALQLGSNNQQS